MGCGGEGEEEEKEEEAVDGLISREKGRIPIHLPSKVHIHACI